MDQDHSGTMTKIVTFFAFKIIRVTMFIMLTSYFLGMIFFIFCQITMKNNLEEFPDGEYFITYFDMDSNSPLQQSIGMTYYAFTTLSTVGFGDLVPRSNQERCFIIMILFFGVALFS